MLYNIIIKNITDIDAIESQDDALATDSSLNISKFKIGYEKIPNPTAQGIAIMLIILILNSLCS